MQVVILAGGLGTRMARFTASMPKALIPVCGRPFVDWQLRWLASQGTVDVVLCVGYRGEAIEDFVQDGKTWDLRVRYSKEQGGLLGTGGALRQAADHDLLRDRFAVLYGDSYLSLDLDDVASTFFAAGKAGLMTVYRNDGRLDRSNADFAHGLVTYNKFAGPKRFSYVDYGLSVLSRSELVRRTPPFEAFDLADFFQSLSSDAELAGYLVEDRFYEVGSEEGRADLEEYLRERRPRRQEERR